MSVDRPEGRIACVLFLLAIALTGLTASGCKVDGGAGMAAPAPQGAQPAFVQTVGAVSDLDRARLAALGYVGSAGPDHAGLSRGVILSRPSAVSGLTFFGNVEGCSAYVVDRAGRRVASWQREPCFRWEAAAPMGDGSIVAIHRDQPPGAGGEASPVGRALVRLGKGGDVRFRTAAPVHHAVDARTPSRPLLALAYAVRTDRRLHGRPVRDDVLLELDRVGRVRRRHSVLDLFERSSAFRDVLDRGAAVDEDPQADDFDLLHTNAVRWMRPVRAGLLYEADRVLLTVRNQNLIAIASLQEGVLWTYGRDELQQPHDASLLDNGHILVFDNRPTGDHSRVLEIDPTTNAIVWSFEGTGEHTFHSVRRGAAERLPNGNTLITSSGEGLILEVTHAGEVVWKYRNTDEGPAGGPVAILRAERYEGR